MFMFKLTTLKGREGKEDGQGNQDSQLSLKAFGARMFCFPSPYQYRD